MTFDVRLFFLKEKKSFSPAFRTGVSNFHVTVNEKNTKKKIDNIRSQVTLE